MQISDGRALHGLLNPTSAARPAGQPASDRANRGERAEGGFSIAAAQTGDRGAPSLPAGTSAESLFAARLAAAGQGADGLPRQATGDAYTMLRTSLLSAGG